MYNFAYNKDLEKIGFTEFKTYSEYDKINKIEINNGKKHKSDIFLGQNRHSKPLLKISHYFTKSLQ